MRHYFPIALLALTLLAPGCKEPPSRAPEFRQVWGTLRESDNWCFGTGRLRAAEKALQERDLSPEDRVNLTSRLAVMHLRLGNNEQAVKAVEKAVELAQNSAPQLLPEIRSRRALVYLRVGEVKNCRLRGSQSSCIFPLNESAVHLDKRPARRALEDLLFYLENEEADSPELPYFQTQRWLLNIAAMQLGEYPGAVPERFRLHLPAEPAGNERQFRDVAAGVGIVHRSLAGGVVTEDFNGDGLLDIATSSCDFRDPTRLYLNQGDGTFADSTEKAGLLDQTGAFNVRAADYDSDGDQDLLLLRGAFLRELGTVRNSLLQNDGEGHFTDVTRSAGLDYPAHPTGTACWGDFNGDGKLDLLVGNETVPQADGSNVAHPCQLYFNNGDGTFSERAEQSGVESLIYVKGVACGDIDNDGDLDLFCGNFGHANLAAEVRGRNLLYRNRGDGTFQEVGEEMGIDWPTDRAFACWFFDYNNDGWLDLLVACYQTEVEEEVGELLGLPAVAGRTALYRNNAGQSFTNVTYTVNLAQVMSTMGAGFGDLDNDGRLDLYLGTGSAYYHHLVPNLALRNLGEEGFKNVTFERGLGHLQKGHGIAFCDFDNDGDQDIYAQMGGNFVGDAFADSLFENPGHGNRFLYLTLKSEFQVVGARIKVDLENRSLHRAVGMVSSFGHTPLRQEIGLGDADKVKRLTVRWPSGATQVFHHLAVDSHYQLREGEPEPTRLALKKLELRQPQPGDPFCEPSLSERVTR